MGHTTWCIDRSCNRWRDRPSNNITIFLVAICHWLDAVDINDIAIHINCGPTTERHLTGNEMWTNFRKYKVPFDNRIRPIVASKDIIEFVFTGLHQRMCECILAGLAIDPRIHVLLHWPGDSRHFTHRALGWLSIGPNRAGAATVDFDHFVFVTREPILVRKSVCTFVDYNPMKSYAFSYSHFAFFRLTWSGKNEKAFHELRRLRGNDALAQEELAEIVEHLLHDSHIERNEMESIWEICTRLTVLKPLVIICVIQTLALISYTYMHIVTAVVSLDAWSFLEDTVGKLYAAFGVLTLLAATSRRFTFITAGAVAAANIFFYGFYLQYEVDMSMSFYVHRIVGLIYHTSGTAFDIAVLLVIAELLPGRVRGSVSAYIFALFFLVANCLSFVSSPSTLVLETWPILTAPGIFIVLALATMAGTGLIYMWMPETKGKTLIDIEAECRVHRWFYDKRRSDCKPVNIEDVENVNWENFMSPSQCQMHTK